MKWYFINSGSNTGSYNMDFDLLLAGSCYKGEAYFRLYKWQPYCISLGANQSYNCVDLKKAHGDNIDVVKRPTGGRAILHAEELTYSVIMPVDYASSARNIYREINLALLKGLKEYDKKLADVELESIQPVFSSIYKEAKGNICFAVSAKSELKFKGKKVAGSAQRKLNNSLLQHGSILCGDFHKRIIKYLNLTSEEYPLLKSELDNNTIELGTILNEKIDYNRLADSLLLGMQNHFEIEFVSVSHPDIVTTNLPPETERLFTLKGHN
jgi:lipoate-protein ligase A